MKPVMQTKRGGPQAPPAERGDCWDACLASILEVPITAVPVPHSDDPEHHWWDESQRALRPHGYYAVSANPAIWPDGYWIAAVPSLNLKKPDGSPVPHVVVMLGGEVAHDPCLGDRYPVGTPIEDLEMLDAFVLVPVETRSLAA
jgi:hypothetical protein